MLLSPRTAQWIECLSKETRRHVLIGVDDGDDVGRAERWAAQPASTEQGLPRQANLRGGPETGWG